MSPDYSSKTNVYPDNVRIVSSMPEFKRTSFSRTQNVVLMSRQLSGDFNAVAEKVLSKRKNDAAMSFDETKGNYNFDTFFHFARALNTPQAIAALEQIARDVEVLKNAGYSSQIRLQRHNKGGRAHVDGSIRSSNHRVLINYSGAATLGWAQSDVDVDVTENPARITFHHGAAPFGMSLGHIWKHMSLSHPYKTPFVHSVPVGNDKPRMLLVADPH